MRIFAACFLTLCMMSCSHRHAIPTTQDGEEATHQLDYALVDTADDRYVIYDGKDVMIDERGAEDVRMISSSYDRHEDHEVVIRSSSSGLSAKRVKKIVELLKAFGVSAEDITYTFIRSELQSHDHIVQLSVRTKHKTALYAGG